LRNVSIRYQGKPQAVFTKIGINICLFYATTTVILG